MTRVLFTTTNKANLHFNKLLFLPIKKFNLAMELEGYLELKTSDEDMSNKFHG